MKQNRELRAAARAQLGSALFSRRRLLALAAILLYSLLIGLLNSLFIGILLLGPLSAGLHLFLLGISRGKQSLSLGALFSFFSEGRFVRTMVLGFLHTFYLFLWSLLFLIPGIVKSYSYRLSYYLACDYPELSPEDCIFISRRLMNGYKKQALLLDLSFVGLMLLGLLACGVGVYFVYPYLYTARTNFYLMLKERGAALLSARDGAAA